MKKKLRRNSHVSPHIILVFDLSWWLLLRLTKYRGLDGFKISLLRTYFWLLQHLSFKEARFWFRWTPISSFSQSSKTIENIIYKSIKSGENHHQKINKWNQEFPDDLPVRIQHFLCFSLYSIPGLGTEVPHQAPVLWWWPI